jgi:DNA-binding response OmpR family regulator
VKILVADDDLELLGLVSFALRQAGYLVLEAPDGRAAVEAFERERPDLVVLDVAMPRLSGHDVLRHIRERSRVPVMMLTVRASEEDVVASLDLGADDHLAKPFSPRTLLARIRALLRRSQGDAPAPVSAAGDVALDLARQTVRVRGGEPVRLTSLEARLLQALLAQAGTPISADRLTTHVWGLRGMGDRQLLKQLVHRLRRKVETSAGEPEYIVTVGGVGYMLRLTAP